MRRTLGLIALTVIIGWLISVFASSLVSAQQPPGDSCWVSKIEYNAAKAEYLLMSRSRVYVKRAILATPLSALPCVVGKERWDSG